MSKQRHLLLIAGFLMMTAPAGIGQVNTAKPGETVERHLSSDQTFREWSHDSKQTDETKLIKVCRAQTVCKMRYREGDTPRMRVRNLTPQRLSALPLTVVQQQLRHGDAKTTLQKYGHVVGDSQRRAVNGLAEKIERLAVELEASAELESSAA